MASTECSTEEEAMSLRRRRLQAPPCSWSRLTYLSTSPSASLLTYGPTPGVRPSHSACLTTGKSFQAAPFQMAPSPTRCIQECTYTHAVQSLKTGQILLCLKFYVCKLTSVLIRGLYSTLFQKKPKKTIFSRYRKKNK